MAKNSDKAPDPASAAPTAGTPAATPVQSGDAATTSAPPAPPAPGKQTAAPVTVVLRHKTPYEVYRRGGLTIRAVPAEFQVTAEQLAMLKADQWVEVKAK